MGGKEKGERTAVKGSVGLAWRLICICIQLLLEMDRQGVRGHRWWDDEDIWAAGMILAFPFVRDICNLGFLTCGVYHTRGRGGNDLAQRDYNRGEPE